MTFLAQTLVDVVIVDGGPAGLAAALGVCRAARTAIVFDSGHYRNEGVSHFHTFPGRDHTDPSELRADARREIETRYPGAVTFIQGEVVEAKKVEDGFFELRDAVGRLFKGRKLVLATGSRDILPSIPGYVDCWPGQIYQCLFCDGIEHKGTATAAGVLCLSPDSFSHVPFNALTAKRFVPAVTVFTNGSMSDDNPRLASLLRKGLAVDHRLVARIEKLAGDAEEGLRLHFVDGPPVDLAFLVHKPPTELSRASAHLASQLGLELTPGGEIALSNAFQQTSVEGVFAAGDCADPMKQVVRAVAQGVTAAGGLHKALVDEELGAA
ncbi:NAD(P)/FAD-dependent oxidoreductase [Rhodotorula paludigena]|uniref:NAD(P)/FAD-dependent oxidoreductase n=1 Tax=Rhodotorula paludigena TaxID=86838 RepID=UPI00317E758D